MHYKTKDIHLGRFLTASITFAVLRITLMAQECLDSFKVMDFLNISLILTNEYKMVQFFIFFALFQVSPIEVLDLPEVRRRVTTPLHQLVASRLRPQTTRKKVQVLNRASEIVLVAKVRILVARIPRTKLQLPQ